MFEISCSSFSLERIAPMSLSNKDVCMLVGSRLLMFDTIHVAGGSDALRARNGTGQPTRRARAFRLPRTDTLMPSISLRCLSVYAIDSAYVS